MKLLNEALFTSPAQAGVAFGYWRTTLTARMENALRVRHGLPTALGSGAALCRRLRANARLSSARPGKSNDQGELRTG